MKRKVENYVKEFKMPHLYLEDLKEINGIIQSELQPKNYKIESEEYEYENLEELLKNINNPNNKMTNLEISLFDISLHICLEKNIAYIELWAPYMTTKNLGVVTKITEVIKKRERKILWFMSSFFGLFFITFVVILFVLGVSNFNWAKKHWLFYLVSFIIWVIWIIMDSWNKRLLSFSVIEFTNKQNKLNFFTKNKEQIFLALISAIIGALALKIFEKIFQLCN